MEGFPFWSAIHQCYGSHDIIKPSSISLHVVHHVSSGNAPRHFTFYTEGDLVYLSKLVHFLYLTRSNPTTFANVIVMYLFTWISILIVPLFYALHLRCILEVHLDWDRLLIETQEWNPIEIRRWGLPVRLQLWIWMYRVVVLRMMLGLLGRVCCNIIWVYLREKEKQIYTRVEYTKGNADGGVGVQLKR